LLSDIGVGDPGLADWWVLRDHDRVGKWNGVAGKGYAVLDDCTLWKNRAGGMPDSAQADVMTIDNTNHRVRQAALRLFFGCFIGGAIVLMYGSMCNHPMESYAFCVIAAVLIFLAVCCVITYLRPDGFPAFITSTAWVGLVAVLEVFAEESQLHALPRSLRLILVWVIPLAWVLKGILKVRAERRAAGVLGGTSAGEGAARI